jgi:hypothetical protein
MPMLVQFSLAIVRMAGPVDVGCELQIENLNLRYCMVLLPLFISVVQYAWVYIHFGDAVN